MLTSQHGSSEEHTFSSDPVNWPFMEQNIIYWIDFQTNVSDLPIAYALFFTIYEKQMGKKNNGNMHSKYVMNTVSEKMVPP